MSPESWPIGFGHGFADNGQSLGVQVPRIYTLQQGGDKHTAAWTLLVFSSRPDRVFVVNLIYSFGGGGGGGGLLLQSGDGPSTYNSVIHILVEVLSFQRFVVTKVLDCCGRKFYSYNVS